MALLQDQQARLKRHTGTRRRKKQARAPVWDNALLVFIVVIALMVIVAMIVRIPDLLPGQRQVVREHELLAKLNDLVSQEIAVVIPKTLEDLQKEVPPQDFTLFATPKTQSARVDTPIIFNVYILRGEGFTAPVTLSATNLPLKASAVSTPQTVTQEKSATMAIQMPSDAVRGNYEFSLTGTSDELQRSIMVSLAVTDLLADDIALIETRAMAQGGKWQATIGWKTSASANTRVDYASQNHYLTQQHSYSYTKTSDENVNNHVLTLFDLEPFTFYHYRILSADGLNNLVVSKDQLFFTAQPADLAIPSETPI